MTVYYENALTSNETQNLVNLIEENPKAVKMYSVMVCPQQHYVNKRLCNTKELDSDRFHACPQCESLWRETDLRHFYQFEVTEN